MSTPSPSPQITYLKDYSPPDFWCPEIVLDIDIQTTYTTVKAELSLAQNPDVASVDRLTLDCDELELLEIAIDNRALSADEYQLLDTSLTLYNPPARFTLSTTVKICPESNTQLMGFIPLSRRLLHPVRSGRVSAHYILLRPSRRHV